MENEKVYQSPTEIRAARMYVLGSAIDCVMANCRMTRQEVLHAVAVYKAAHRNTHPECEHCRMRSGDRPCVWPKGVCGL